MSKGDLISRSALLEEYKKLWGNSFSAILDLIRNAPAADVAEVVRCKDCAEYGHCGCLEISKPDDFCSYGRKNKRAENG